jgi:hypothetical protein
MKWVLSTAFDQASGKRIPGSKFHKSEIGIWSQQYYSQITADQLGTRRLLPNGILVSYHPSRTVCLALRSRYAVCVVLVLSYCSNIVKIKFEELYGPGILR